jgi:hypothetical protein
VTTGARVINISAETAIPRSVVDTPTGQATKYAEGDKAAPYLDSITYSAGGKAAAASLVDAAEAEALGLKALDSLDELTITLINKPK